MNLALDEVIGAQAPDATHQLRTHPASLPADKTLSLQLISVCGWCSPWEHVILLSVLFCMEIYSNSSFLVLVVFIISISSASNKSR